MTTPQARDTALSTFALFTSLGTLLCCALPALLVGLGAGAVLAGMVSAWPQITFVSEHKAVVFWVAGVALTLAASARYASRNAPCPIEPGQAAACRRLRRFGDITLAASIMIYAVGAFFAFGIETFLS